MLSRRIATEIEFLWVSGKFSGKNTSKLEDREEKGWNIYYFSITYTETPNKLTNKQWHRTPSRKLYQTSQDTFSDIY